MKNAVDVLIVGEGPVGLLLAAELSRDGVEVLLIDRLARRSRSLCSEASARLGLPGR